MVWIGIVAVIVILEYIIKHYMDRKLKKDGDIIKGNLHFNRYHNKGMALNMLEKHKSIIFGIVGVLIGFFLLLFVCVIRTSNRTLEKLGLSFLLGGAISNYIDRIQHGYVIDYFSLTRFKRLKHIVFNLADMCIFLGGFLIILGQIFGKKR